MEILNGRRLSARYRFEVRTEGGKDRLDRILRIVTQERLAGALARTGFDGLAIVCLRSVASRVRLNLAQSDEALATEWSLALAASIEGAVREGGSLSSGLVSFRSRAHALLDLVLRVAAGDTSRVWAWRQIGLWPAGERAVADGVLFALSAEPHLIAPVLAEAVATTPGTFAKLISLLDAENWLRLARLAWSSAGGPASAFAAPVATPDPLPAWLQARVASLLRESRIAIALRQLVITLPAGVAATAFAALAILESDSSAASAHSAMLPAIAGKIAEGPDHSGCEEEPPCTSEPAAAAAVRAKTSRYGGLLYLLPLLEATGIVAEITGPGWRRGIAWSLHRLAMSLVPCTGDDPAALALAGLGPEARLPSQLEPPCEPAEAELIALWRERVVTALEARLEGHELRSEALLRFVVWRPCRVIADPGWLEIRYPLDSVSTEIRRAGLDLNPGYLPWLGTTMVFIYE